MEDHEDIIVHGPTCFLFNIKSKSAKSVVYMNECQNFSISVLIHYRKLMTIMVKITFQSGKQLLHESRSHYTTDNAE